MRRLLILSCLLVLTLLCGTAVVCNAKPKVKVIIEVGEMPSCSGTGFCGIKITVNFIRQSNDAEATLEYADDALKLSFYSADLPEQLRDGFEKDGFFAVNQPYQLPEELTASLEMPDRATLVRGNYRIIKEDDRYVIMIPVE